MTAFVEFADRFLDLEIMEKTLARKGWKTKARLNKKKTWKKY